MTIRYHSSTMVMEWQEVLQELEKEMSHFIVITKEEKHVGHEYRTREFITTDLYTLEKIMYDYEEQDKSKVTLVNSHGSGIILSLYEIINVKGIRLH
ncbi:hypothetical protein DIGNKC_292 [Bacillus phage DIGNKC]|uniref:hypothetical protein n=1 Tax=Bacillus phage DIGNKC TaxID=1805948 RepID=UPI0007A77368|nr:hypothetical protein BI007_gp082 [Bacillus phage DIGNKC]AMW62761.1 hypothetical protein DIGNKC_292 [Bacillus phage DIGNKC]